MNIFYFDLRFSSFFLKNRIENELQIANYELLTGTLHIFENFLPITTITVIYIHNKLYSIIEHKVWILVKKSFKTKENWLSIITFDWIKILTWNFYHYCDKWKMLTLVFSMMIL